MKKILIIGINGFLGRNLYELLSKEGGCDIYGIDRVKGIKSKNIFRCDLNQYRKLKKILLKINPDIIFNLSGGRLEEPQKLYRHNFLAALSLLKIIEETDALNPRIVMAGTAAEYGRPKEPNTKINETSATEPATIYGFVKYMLTNLCMLFARRDVNIVIGRIFNICGAGISDQLAIGRFAREIASIERGEKGAFVMTKNLDGFRDFLDVQDVTSALWALAQNGQAGEIYNICSGQSFSMKELLEKMIKLSTTEGIEIMEEKDESSSSFDIVGANEKIKEATGWSPQINIDKSLQETLDYYRQL